MQTRRQDPAQPPRSDEASALAQAKAAFLLTMRARGIQDLDVLRALEMVPREIFVPHRYADLARRQLALPLRCGQTLPEPWLAARMIEVLAPSPNHRVLEIGTGSGYATALLARLAREVISIERFQSLAIEAGARLEQLGIHNAGVTWGDGAAIGPAAGPFDRIIVQGSLSEIPAPLIEALAADGVLVTARPDPSAPARQHVVRIARDEAGGFDETPICPCRLQAILPGEAQAL
jgi:protein-L-isoaspartate(D-aspartate) O-methyltransferase